MNTVGQPRTFNTWAIIGVFAVLGAIGIFLFIGGDHRGSTEVVPTKQLLTDASTSEVPSSPDPTAPGKDGDADADAAAAGPDDLPPGVTHQQSGTANAYVFTPPDDLAGAAGADLRIEVAKATVAASDDGIVVTVECTSSAQEFLAQVSVDEGPQVVTVIPVILIPPQGAPCAPGAAARSISLPLGAPLGTRTVNVAPAGSTLPELGAATPN